VCSLSWVPPYVLVNSSATKAAKDNKTLTDPEDKPKDFVQDAATQNVPVSQEFRLANRLGQGLLGLL